ncbi:LLM class flavin-dependent oxidoreductase [Leptospira congkakensis]|uniref:Luciferase-like monooxygenase n=1 Tax=Leptospira congkakensis TaxID=2484932 RepID=A0A4Z1A4F2_9LEPT|nr:LLM class flavin-dependent oxidoreductase [Leptospira congkakensis]TGL87170.1 LLM class flavin-dependent oxidoreductase [Leptospira congkakensis]TGL96738.1 LLM class flavin-dependent oxidoreductase [Leptospira congkakensis]TGL97587.1 LLM class flavin-dependent oxidoreductase [Leptospira congkakensis]
MAQLSILDLVFINEGNTPKDALANSVRVAQAAESLGYHRIWVAEHHNFPSIASAATSVVIGHLAGHTKSIRIGAGGIMLPNHSPLVIAEQFGTLESLYPGRIDLGLGRAPGTDQLTLRALRRDAMSSQTFPEDVKELLSYFEDDGNQLQVRAIPGTGTHVPVWILGSSLFGAQLAAMFGLPYAFASHFAPDALMEAITIYRKQFRPSQYLDKPYVMVGVNVIAAETDKEASFLFTSSQQSFTRILRNRRGTFPPPIEDIESYWSPEEKQIASRMLSYSVVGSPETVKAGITKVLEETKADELMTVTSVYDTDAKIKSLELLAKLELEVLQ